MGEIIKKFSKLPIGLEIELNEPQSDGGDYIIHLQNEHGRIALTKSEFVQLAILFCNAKDALLKYKESDKNE